MTRWRTAWVPGWLVLVMLTVGAVTGLQASRVAAPARDAYGGCLAVPVPGGATGFFRVAKVDNRWVFATPDGHAFWMLSVYHANEAFLETDVIERKYGGDVDLWATQRNRRLLSWGFNTLGEFTSTRGLPVGVWGSKAVNQVKLPFILILNAAVEAGARPAGIRLPEPLKDILRGVPTTVYNGYRAPLGDFYSPLFSYAVRNTIAYWNNAITGGFADKPWIVGITTDDADGLYGFKSRSGPGVYQPYPHPGFLIATAKFLYTSADHPQGKAWLDPKLHTKYAWVDFLKATHGTIAALNQAWGTGGFYTGFDSAGGYGTGTGVIDEDGRHRWMGRLDRRNVVQSSSPGVQADLDAFLYEFAKTYASVTVSRIRAIDRNHLIFGPAALNNYGTKARDEILRGLADGGIDVFQYGYEARNPQPGLTVAQSMGENNQSYDVTGKPAFIWYTVTANADSGWAGTPPFRGAPDFPAQELRGQRYADDLQRFLDARGANGDYYIVGVDWWELVDTRRSNEAANMGLITWKDNAYDGREAVVAPGKDPWGYATGGERRNYGDFLRAVRKANHSVYPKAFPTRQAAKTCTPM